MIAAAIGFDLIDQLTYFGFRTVAQQNRKLSIHTQKSQTKAKHHFQAFQPEAVDDVKTSLLRKKNLF